MLGALKARSRPSSLPADLAEPETPSLRSLRPSSVLLEDVGLVGQVGRASAVRPSLTRLR